VRVDEVGRGCLSDPSSPGAVVLPASALEPLARAVAPTGKALSARHRERLVRDHGPGLRPGTGPGLSQRKLTAHRHSWGHRAGHLLRALQTPAPGARVLCWSMAFCPLYDPGLAGQVHPVQGDRLAWPLPQPVCSPKQARDGLVRRLGLSLPWLRTGAPWRLGQRRCHRGGLCASSGPPHSIAVLFSPRSCSVLPAPGR